MLRVNFFLWPITELVKEKQNHWFLSILNWSCVFSFSLLYGMCGLGHQASLDFSAVSFFVPLVPSCSVGMCTKRPSWWLLFLSGIKFCKCFIYIVVMVDLFCKSRSAFPTKFQCWIGNHCAWKPAKICFAPNCGFLAQLKVAPSVFRERGFEYWGSLNFKPYFK